jgi:hypothetical protein
MRTMAEAKRKASRFGWQIVLLSAVILLSSCGGPARKTAEHTDPPVRVTVPSGPTTSTPSIPPSPSVTGLLDPEPRQSLQFVNDVNGWLIDGSQIFATTDGGNRWRQSYTGIDGPLALDFIGPDVGWVLADVALPHATSVVLLHTTDGGQNWTTLGGPTGAVLLAIDFVGPTTGWALTTGGSLMVTTDGGADWTKVAAPTSASLCVSTNGLLWLGTEVGTVEESDDNGTSWQVALPLATVASVIPGHAVPGLTCSGPDAWALYDLGEAAGSSEYAVLATSDGGRQWFPLLASTATGARMSLPNTSASVAADGVSGSGSAWFLGFCGACDSWGAVEIVTSSGSSVLRTTQLPEVSLAADASFVNPMQGWIVGTDAAALVRPPSMQGYPLDVLATSDGGATWHVVSTIPPEP